MNKVTKGYRLAKLTPIGSEIIGRQEYFRRHYEDFKWVFRDTLEKAESALNTHGECGEPSEYETTPVYTVYTETLADKLERSARTSKETTKLPEFISVNRGKLLIV